MILIFFSHLIWVLAILGFGSILEALGRLGNIKLGLNEVDFAIYGFFGLIVMSVIGTIANFWVALSPPVSSMVGLAGLALFVRNRKAIIRRMSGLDVVFLSILLLYLSLTTWREIRHYDTGYYHLQQIKWTTEVAVPLGLANLNGKFGFNSSWLTVAALLELPSLVTKSGFVISEVLTFFFGSAGYFSLKRNLSGRISPPSLFLTFSAALLMFTVPVSWIPSTSTDLPVTVIALFATYLLSYAFEGFAERWVYSLLAILFAVFGFTVKLSAAPLALGTILVVLWKWRKNPNHLLDPKIISRALPLIVVGCLLILLPWVMRGMVLSGCPAYPSRFGCVTGLQWTVPSSLADNEARWIRSWSRQPHLRPEVVLSSWDWLKPWIKRYFSNMPIRLLIGLQLLGTIFLLASLLRRRPLRYPKDSFVLPLLISIGGIAFWFVTAPDPRFGYGYLLSFVLLVLCFGLTEIGFSRLDGKWRAVVFAGVLLALFARAGTEITPSIRTGHLTGWPQIPEVRLVHMETTEGVRIYAPAEGDQCWAAPLPCTPNPDLKLRTKPSEAGLPKMFWYPR